MFSSILFDTREQADRSTVKIPFEGYHDLHLDYILSEAIQNSEWKGVENIFKTPTDDCSLIMFRQKIMSDFDSKYLRTAAKAFSASILRIERQLKKLQQRNRFQSDFLDCSDYLQLADAYCTAIEQFAKMDRRNILSFGLRRCFEELDHYIGSPSYQVLLRTVRELHERMEKIHFCMLIKDGCFKVRPFENQQHIDAEVQSLFSRFQQNDLKTEHAETPEIGQMHHIDAAVLELLAHWYRDDFDQLRHFAADGPIFIESGIASLAKEVCFYLSWQSVIEPLREKGLPFCCAEICSENAELHCEDGFDLALALQQHRDGKPTITNSFYMHGEERILVVTGPNQGGKTTFARFLGQIFYLTSIGCCVPGKSAALRCFDGIYTHFNREEDLNHLNGKLQDDILRLDHILSAATSRSILIINEIYASTTLHDAIYLGNKMMEKIVNLGCLAVCVTFLDELASYDNHTVSMMSTVDELNPTVRNFKIVRKPADGLAFAIHLAEKYGLSYEILRRRLQI